MRNRWSGILALSFLLVLALGLNTKAQVAGDLTAEIPFSFYAGYTLLPPGEYLLKMGAAGLRVLTIQGQGHRVSVYLETEDAQAVEPRAESYLLFNKFGDEYFLSEGWFAGESAGFRVPKSHMELKAEGKGLAKEQKTVKARRARH